jgi:hypothetical protein
MFEHTLIVKGSSQDLDAIFSGLHLDPSAGQIVRHGDPADVKLTSEQTRQMLSGNPLFFGTTRVEIRFNGNKDELKQSILKRFPKVTIMTPFEERNHTHDSMNNPQDWIRSKFTVADLHQKTVEYSLRGEDGHTYLGEGRLIAIAKGDLMRVRIMYQQGMAKDMSHVSAGVFIIPGSDAARLVRNPPGSKCEFSFKAL